MCVVHRKMLDSLAYGVQSSIALLLYNLVHNALTMELEKNRNGPTYKPASLDTLLSFVDVMSDVYGQLLFAPDSSTVFDFMRHSLQKAGKLSQLAAGFGAKAFHLFADQIREQKGVITELQKNLPFNSYDMNERGKRVHSLSSVPDLITKTNSSRWSRVLSAQCGEIASTKLAEQNEAPKQCWSVNGYDSDTTPTSAQLDAAVVFVVLRRIERYQAADLLKVKKSVNPKLKAARKQHDEDLLADAEEGFVHDEEFSDLGNGRLSAEEEDPDDERDNSDKPDFFECLISSYTDEDEKRRVLSDAGPTLPKNSRHRKIPLVWLKTESGKPVYPNEFQRNIGDILLDKEFERFSLSVRTVPKVIDYQELFVHEATSISAITCDEVPRYFTETLSAKGPTLIPSGSGLRPSSQATIVGVRLKIGRSKRSEQIDRALIAHHYLTWDGKECPFPRK